jgi:crotonobetainyl-CoA:carnitine CoA-transferase CaiB-like acyl-CoA transferase
VLVTNLLPKVQKKLKIDFGNLKNINPKLIHASLTGFGLKEKEVIFRAMT